MCALKTTTEYRHREAYCLMRYASEDGQVVEWIWNSRDGVVPFCVTSKCGKKMQHVHWAHDVRIVDYSALPGERIFVDATPDLLRPLAETSVRRIHPTARGHVFDVLVAEQIRMWMPSPLLTEVGDTYETDSSLGKAIAIARAKANATGG